MFYFRFEYTIYAIVSHYCRWLIAYACFNMYFYVHEV